MKKFIQGFTLFAIVFLCVLSCKKDDPAPPSIEGKWTETTYVVSGCDDPSDNEPETTCTTSCEVFVISATTITSDGDVQAYTKTATTITVSDGSFSLTFTYTVTETTLVLTLQNSSTFGGCKEVRTFKRS